MYARCSNKDKKERLQKFYDNYVEGLRKELRSMKRLLAEYLNSL